MMPNYGNYGYERAQGECIFKSKIYQMCYCGPGNTDSKQNSSNVNNKRKR